MKHKYLLKPWSLKLNCGRKLEEKEYIKWLVLQFFMWLCGNLQI